jgi:hypothetical protein
MTMPVVCDHTCHYDEMLNIERVAVFRDADLHNLALIIQSHSRTVLASSQSTLAVAGLQEQELTQQIEGNT